MFVLIVTEKGGSPKRQEFDKDEITIGRVPGNDVILPKGNVSKRHSRLVRQDGRFFVVDLKSTNGTYLNGRRITTPSPIRPGDKIYVGDYVISLDSEAAAGDEANFGDLSEAEPMDSTPQPSSDAGPIDPIPLDQEPPDSQPPPPPMPRSAPSAPGMGGPPSRPMPGAAPVPNRPTQPPPRLSAPSLPRPPGGSPSIPTLSQGSGGAPQVPSRPGMGAPPRSGTLMGSGVGGSPQMPGARPSPSQPMPAAGELRPTAAPPRMPARAPAPPPEPEPEPAGDPTPPPMPAAEPAPAPMPSPRVAPVPAATASAPLVQPAPQPVVVQHTPTPAPQPVVQSSPAPAPSMMGMPAVLQPSAALPAGFEARGYGAVLAAVLQDARAAGAVAPAERPADAGTRARIRAAVESAARRSEPPEGVSLEQVVRDATAELAGTGPFEVALEDATVTQVSADPLGRVYWARSGPAQLAPLVFSAPESVTVALDRLLSQAGVVRAPEQRQVRATMADGTRLHAVATPAGWHVSLERAPLLALTLGVLVSRGVLSAPASAMLAAALRARRNVLLAGPPGSGRSTLLAAMVESLEDRCVVVESGREVARSLPGPTAIDAAGDWHAAVSFAVSLRPARLAFGDSHEAAAGHLVSALATGSEGLLAVSEGPTGALALGRLAALAAKSGAWTREEALGRLAATRPLVVVLSRLGDGSLRVVSLGEARAAESGGVHVDEAFVFRAERASAPGRIEGGLAATGLLPSFAQEL